METHYIYLLQEREFIKTKENIYKIGKTVKINLTRFRQYPNGSRLILQQLCHDCDIMEKNIISVFKTKFIRRKDIGNEYFEENYKRMVKIINKFIDDENDINDNSDDTSIDIDVKSANGHYCKICNKCFARKRDLIDHINRKKPCINHSNTDNLCNICNICNNQYSSDGNLRKHKVRCKKKNVKCDK